jgi:hypothetical protein
MFRCLPRPHTPPEPTGCARSDAVVSMMHHLESTYEWQTGWDDRHEDTYCEGEMLSYRRIFYRGKKVAEFIFCEDAAASYCYLTAGGNSVSVFTRAEYDEAISALEAGEFAAFAAVKKLAAH